MFKKLFQSGDKLACNDSLLDDLIHCFFHFKKQLWNHLRSKGYRHWIIASGLIILALYIGHILNEQNFWIHLRYQTYQYFLQTIATEQPHPKRTTLVMINDNDYYEGPFEARKPLKRDYLAKLLKKLDAANPEVIALDVNLSSPGQHGNQVTFGNYENETNELLDAIHSVSQNRTVVLAKTIIFTDPNNEVYKPVPAIYENYGFNEKKVLKGFITLPRDIRRVPLAWRMEDGSTLDSFASAIVKAVDNKCLKKPQADENDGLSYGKFIKPEEFTVLTASEVLNTTDTESLKKAFGFKIVIIGGSWHKEGFNRGPKNDGHPSPVGVIDGAYIHANYVEALLSSDTIPPMKEFTSILIDLFFAVVLTIGLSLPIRFPSKVLIVLMLSIVMIIISYIAWQNLGMYFDFFIPVFLLFSHVLVEKIFRE